MPRTRLLVVDDDRFFASILQQILAEAGYAVSLAADGHSALERLATDPAFDAILLDRQMPDLDGLEVLRRIKGIEAFQGIPVILQTGMNRAEEILDGLRAGAFYYLVKPLDAKLLLQVVAAATAEQEARRQLWAEMDGVRSAMGSIQRGLFRYQTLQQCRDLASLLAKACPDPKRSVVGLSELMINAVEHGNLGITYAEKSALIEAHAWREEVERRQLQADHADQWVTVALVRSERLTRFRITDMGRGFAWAEFQEVNPERIFDSHGRGILLARWEAFDRVQYLGAGNSVRAEIDHR